LQVLHHNRERPLQQLRITAYPFFTSETFNKKGARFPRTMLAQPAHQMIVTLERNGLIRRQADIPQKHRNPRAARKLADPKLARYQTVKITVKSH